MDWQDDGLKGMIPGTPLVPNRYNLILAVVCGLLFLVIPWWAALLVYVVGFMFLAWIGYRGYRNAVNLVGHITGLDLQRSTRLYEAAVTGNWADIPTEDLKYDPVAGPKKGIRSKFIDQLQTQITTERVRREVAEGTHEMQSGIYREGPPPEIKEAMERRKRKQT